MARLTINQALQLARQHHSAGRLPQADQLYRLILSRNHNHIDALHGLGIIAHQVGRNDAAGDQFVRIAVELANDIPRLKELRSSLRRRMEQSPLMDAPKFARNIEAAYRTMWQSWCKTTPANS